MKKYLPYLLVIILLLAVAGWFIYNQSPGTINAREGQFSVKHGKGVSKIILSETDAGTVELSNATGVWMVNGKYAAREDLIDNLLKVIIRVQSLSPVPVSAQNNVVREMLAHHVRVQIFDVKHNLLKSYWVGGPSTDAQNTYMLLETDGKPATRPHLTYIPGIKGYLTGRYNTDEETWRTKVLFNYKEEDIKALSVAYLQEEQNSFNLTRVAPDSFALSPASGQYKIEDSYQQKYIRQYLAFYSSIYLETFDNGLARKDSLLKSTPFCTISITENDNSVNTVKLYHMPVSKRTRVQFDFKGNDMPYDLEHYHASVHNGKDLAIVQYYTFGKILRNYKEFFFKPAAVGAR